MPDQPLPLPRSSAPCWRCGGESWRQGLCYTLCEACQQMLREVQQRYQGPQATSPNTEKGGDRWRRRKYHT
jgi:hypothetical protein